MTSLVDAESVLAIDIGSINTRALLFDLVDGQYHFISTSTAPTTASAPFHDVSEGVHLALQRLQEVTGRTLIDQESRLIIPSQPDGDGVDRLAVTCSAGGDLKIVTMGLLSDVSMQSAQRLAATTYSRIVESIGLMNDRRRPDAQLDAVLLAEPDIIIISGGTDRGATRSVYRLAEMARQVCRILPKERRPRILYCGNQALAKRIKESLELDTRVSVAPNIRPTIDLEDITPASVQLAKLAAKVRAQKLGGLSQYASISSAVLPSAFALGRMMRFMNGLSTLAKPTLGVDLGAGSTTLAAASADESYLHVSSSLGVGTSLSKVLEQIDLEDVARWVPYDLPVEEVRDYLYQKSLFPASLPLTPETLAIEQALARVVLNCAAQKFRERYPALQNSYEYIFISGAALVQAPTPAQTVKMILDGLQPVGVNVLMLDPHGLSQALGAIASTNTLLPAQILETGAYTNLATVICPVSDARPGTTILRLKIIYEEGGDTQVEVKQGSIVKLPIRYGQTASLQVEALHGTILDPAAPRLNRGVKNIVGGVSGVVVDARGRPLALPGDLARSREKVKIWSQSLDEL